MAINLESGSVVGGEQAVIIPEAFDTSHFERSSLPINHKLSGQLVS